MIDDDYDIKCIVLDAETSKTILETKSPGRFYDIYQEIDKKRSVFDSFFNIRSGIWKDEVKTFEYTWAVMKYLYRTQQNPYAVIILTFIPSIDVSTKRMCLKPHMQLFLLAPTLSICIYVVISLSLPFPLAPLPER